MASLVYVLFTLFFHSNPTVANSGANKRILVSDPDVVQQVMLLKQEVDLLKSELSAAKSESQSFKQEITQLKSSLTVVQNELTNKISANAGSVYVRWGKSSCPQTDTNTEQVYSGFVAGESHIHSGSNRFGGASNYLCLPHDPELTNRTLIGSSQIYGTEYEENILRTDAGNEDAPCAVCKSPKTSIMIPGRKTCYLGWTKEYSGYLASDAYVHKASSFICLDKDIEYVPGGVENKNGRLLYMTSTKCGSLSCPPYKNDQMVYCVVCSK